MSTRDTVLGNIRAALGRQEALSDSEQEALRARMDERRIATRPLVGDDLIVTLKAGMDKVQMTYAELASEAEVPAAVVAHLDQHGLAHEVVLAPSLVDLDWPEGLFTRGGRAEGSDHVSVSACLCAVAETGSIVLPSSAENPTTLNFLPDDHIVVLKRSRVVRHLEDVWPLLRALGERVPRAVNVNTGPSRTGDIEQTIEIGAHGPRRMHALIVND